MCGIAGICFESGANSLAFETQVSSMLELLKHRGSQSPTTKIIGDCVLGHTRLPIVGGQTNAQPMVYEDVAVAFNGEIYNYLDLRTELIGQGCRFQTRGDAEVLLHAYLVWGTMFPEKLRGIWAFAIYDRRYRRLILGRDQVGVKPLYYQVSAAPGFVWFASEAKALVCTALGVQVDKQALAQYLHFQHTLDDHTLFKDIRKVLPGQMLVFDCPNREYRAMTYWGIDHSLVRSDAADHYKESYYQNRILQVLSRVAREQASMCVDSGVYVSGGIDSSAVGALLAEYLPGMKMISGYYEVPGHDESEYAEALASWTQATDFVKVPITESQVAEALIKGIYHLDEPVAGPGMVGQWVLAQEVRNRWPNMKVMFGGQGGDELFGGYARYVVAYLESCLHGAIYPNPKRNYVLTLDKLVPFLPVLQGYEPMIKQFLSNNLFEDRDHRYFELLGRFSTSQLSFGALEELSKTKACDQVYDQYLRIFSELGSVSYFTKMTYFDFKTSLPALLQVDDRMNASVELESRVPLLDEELINLAFSIPPAYKFAGGHLKGLFRKALTGLVPPKILERRDKMGFPVPFGPWLKARGPVWELVAETLRNDATGLFKPLPEVPEAFNRDLWGRLSLGLWARAFKVGGW